MDEQTKSNKWIIFAGIGCIALVCICGTLIGAFFVFQRTASSFLFSTDLQTYIPDDFLGEIGTPDIPQIEIPTLPPIELPTLPAIEDLVPTLELFGTDPDLTGNQYLDDSTLIDDFSSQALEWPVFDDGLTILQYENQAYSFQITEPDYYDWAYAPTPFYPSYIMFDVWGLPGEQDGTFGVFCQYQDEVNYYYVEFDLQTKEALIGIIENNEFIPLTEPDSTEDNWIMVDALKPSPEEVNTIAIECQLEKISLMVNTELVQMVSIDSPFNNPGEMAFFVYTFSFAGPEGYKVFFDNVLIR
jgi:hypothetical protein